MRMVEWRGMCICKAREGLGSTATLSYILRIPGPTPLMALTRHLKSVLPWTTKDFSRLPRPSCWMALLSCFGWTGCYLVLPFSFIQRHFTTSAISPGTMTLNGVSKSSPLWRSTFISFSCNLLLGSVHSRMAYQNWSRSPGVTIVPFSITSLASLLAEFSIISWLPYVRLLIFIISCRHLCSLINHLAG